jgi:flagellar biosynthesis/type III secretory pathway protein FliH
MSYEHDPWWEERTDLPLEKVMWERGYEEGYHRGFEAGKDDKEELEKLRRKTDAMEELLHANARVLREELKKELLNEGQKRI